MLLLGAHLSASGGWWKAPAAARSARCEVVQLFLRPPGRWGRTAPSPADVERFVAVSRQAGLVGRCWAHAPYLLNLASGDDLLRRRSVATLVEELRWAGELGLAGVVLHPGSAGQGDRREAEARCRDALGEALAASGAAAARLLLEGAAGAGGQLGVTPAELASLRPAGAAARVGVCLDTAHLWAAGYDLRGEGWTRVLGELGEHWGVTAPDLIHGNDTAVRLGARWDRHAEPGRGILGEPFFRALLADALLAGAPLVVEIPPGLANRNISKVMRRLRAWAA